MGRLIGIDATPARRGLDKGGNHASSEQEAWPKFSCRDVRITIVKIDHNSIRIGIDAPDHVSIQREEIAFEVPELTFQGGRLSIGDQSLVSNHPGWTGLHQACMLTTVVCRARRCVPG